MFSDEFGYDADDKVAFRELCADVAKLKARQKKISELLLSLTMPLYHVHIEGDERTARTMLIDAYDAISAFANEIEWEYYEDDHIDE